MERQKVPDMAARLRQLHGDDVDGNTGACKSVKFCSLSHTHHHHHHHHHHHQDSSSIAISDWVPKAGNQKSCMPTGSPAGDVSVRNPVKASLNDPEKMTGIGIVSREAQGDPLLDEFPALPEAAPSPAPSDKSGVHPTGELAAGISSMQIGGSRLGFKGPVPGAFRAPAPIRVPALEKGQERRGARPGKLDMSILSRPKKVLAGNGVGEGGAASAEEKIQSLCEDGGLRVLAPGRKWKGPALAAANKFRRSKG